MGGRAALLRTLREGLAKVAAMPSCRPCLADGRQSRSPAKAARRRCHAFLLPVPRRWATQPLPCEGFEKVFQTLSTAPQPLSCERSARSCEGSCHAFLPPVPRRWATQPALLRTLREGLAKVAAMPSCRPCLADGRRNLLSCERCEKVLRR